MSNTDETTAGGAPHDVDEPAPAATSHPHRRRWLVVAAVAVGIVVLVVGGFVALFVVREDPGAKPLGEAIDEFRDTASTSTPSVLVRRPTAGVYSATGEGHEALSFPPLSQTDGDLMPVTVTYTSDTCWTFAIDYNVAHSQSWDYCPGDVADTIAEQGSRTEQRWDVGAMTISNSTTFTCDPPALLLAADAAPGQTWDQSCGGTNSEIPGTTRSVGPYRFVGVETVVIDGTEVTAHRYSQTRQLSGAQTGQQTTEIWVEVATGLPLRAERTVRVDSSSPVGDITYTEEGWWQLQSRAPAR